MNKFYLTCLVAFCFYGVQAQKTIVHCGTLIDGKSNEAQQQMTIVIEGNKISAVEKGYTKPGKDDKLIDLTKKTVMPGFIDMHVHLEGETNKDQALQRFTLNDADVAFQINRICKKDFVGWIYDRA